MKATIFCLLLFLTANLFSQTDWTWVKSAGIDEQENVAEVTADGFGNSYLCGDFSGPSVTFGSTTLTNPANDNFFLAKYDAAGNVLWARTGEPSVACGAGSASSDKTGNVCVAGQFIGNQLIVESDTLTGVNGEGFLLKYDSAGTLLWSRSFGGANSEFATGVYLDEGGNCYLTGNFRSPTFTIGSTVLVKSGTGNDIFVAKYDAYGNLLWARSAGGTLSDGAIGLTVDAAGNCFVTGYFPSDTINFDSIAVINSSYYNDTFLAKYDAYGNLLWVRTGTGFQNEGGASVATDAQGNCFVTGYFISDTVMFGSAMVVKAGTLHHDIFLVKYDPSGNVLWAKSIGGPEVDVVGGVSTDSYGNCFVAGLFHSPLLNIGSFTVTNADPSGDTSDGLLVKYDPAGNMLWVKSFGAYGDEAAVSVDLNVDDVCFVGGTFTSLNVTFGPHTLTNPINPSGGTDMDVFIAKLEDVTGINSADANANSISVFPNPSDGMVTVNADVTGGNVSVYAMTGEIVFESVVDAFPYTIDLSGQAGGMYFIRVESETGNAVKKIIVEK